MEVGGNILRYYPRKLLRLENIDSCWKFMEKNSIRSFVELFCNETLSKVYRLLIFSTDLEPDKKFLNEVQKAIDFESIKRKFDCFQLVKQSSESVQDVIYCNEKIIYLDQ